MISPRLPAQTEDSVQFDGFEAADSMKEVASWPWGHNLVTFVQFDVWSLEARGTRGQTQRVVYLYSITV